MIRNIDSFEALLREGHLEDTKRRHINAFKICEASRVDEVRGALNACNETARAYAHVVDNNIYIAPTTGRPTDWAINFIVAPLATSPLLSMIHIGFAITAKALYPRVIRHLDKKKPVYVYGYSQGAAVAQILAHWLNLHGYKVAEVITFACPRPYTLLYRLLKRVHSPGLSINYVTRGDLVTWIPFWLTRTGKTILLGSWKDWRPVWISHQPQTYVRHLENLS